MIHIIVQIAITGLLTVSQPSPTATDPAIIETEQRVPSRNRAERRKQAKLART